MVTFTRNVKKYISIIFLISNVASFQQPKKHGASGKLRTSETKNWNYESVLIENLMKGYNKDIRSSRNRSEVVQITFRISLTQLISLEEKSQILTTNCWFSHNWIDWKLRWNPVDYANITTLMIPMDDIWTPDILLYNNADSEYYHKVMTTNAIVQHNGNVTWMATTIIRSTCEIDVKYFPFDVQNCFLKFASWTYHGDEVDLVVLTDAADISHFIPSCEWDLKSVTAKRTVTFYNCCKEPFPDITIYISIRRRPLFYVFNYLIPCGGASVLAFMGFFAPGESGEKVTLGITVLLSLTLFLLNIGEVMPPTATSIPLIAMYYGATMLFVALITTVQVWTLNIHFRGTRNQQIPKWMKRILSSRFVQLFVSSREMISSPRKSSTSYDLQLSGQDELQSDSDGNPMRRSYTDIRLKQPLRDEPSTAKMLALRLNELMQCLDLEMDKQDIREEHADSVEFLSKEWRQIAQVADNLLLIMFLATIICLTVVMFLNIPEIFDS